MNKKELVTLVNQNITKLDSSVFDLLEKLMNITIETNEKFNLTAITNEDDFSEKLILDSALVLQLEGLDNKKCIDIGTGAGFPGMVLAILNPSMTRSATKRAIKC